MARPPPYHLPTEKQIDIDEEKSVKGWKFGFGQMQDQVALLKKMRQQSQRYADASAAWAKERAPNDLAKQRKLAIDHFNRTYGKHKLSTAGLDKAVRNAFAQGGHKTPDDVLPTKEQRKAIARDEPWKRTKRQGRTAMVEEAAPEDRARVFMGDFTEEEQKRYDELMAEEMRGPPDKAHWFMQGVEKLGVSGIAKRSALASVVGDLQELSPPPDFEEPGDVEKFLRSGARRLGDVPLPGLSVLSTAARAALGERVAGIDVPAALSKAWDEGKLGDIAEDALRAMWAGAKSSQAVPLSRPLKDARDTYMKAAIRHVVDERGWSTEEAKARKDELMLVVDDLVDRALDRDVAKWAIENPHITEFAVEVAGDELTYIAPFTAAVKLGRLIPGGKAAVRGAKAVGRAGANVARAGVDAVEGSSLLGERVVQQGRKTVEDVQDAARFAKEMGEKFVFMPMMKRFQKKGSRHAQAASRARMAHDEAVTVIAKAAERAGQLLNVMRRVRKADRAKLDEYLRMPKEEADLLLANEPKKALVEGARAGRELGDLLFENMSESGLTRRWYRTSDEYGRMMGAAEEGTEFKPSERQVLTEIEARQDYVPNLLDEDITKRRDRRADAFLRSKDLRRNPSGRDSLIPRGAHKRTGETKALKDPVAQYEAKVQNEFPRALKARQLVATHHAMEEMGFAITVDQKNVKTALEQARQMSPENEWVALIADGTDGADVQQTYSRLTGNVGDELYRNVTIVPREYKEVIDALLPAMPTGDAAFLMDAGRYLLRPFQIASKHFRYFSTVPNYAFSFRNMVGAIGLSTLAHGLQAFNPQFQGKAALASFLAASGNPKAMDWLGDLTWTTRNGDKVPMSKVVTAAQDVGLLGQLDHRLAMEAFGDTRGVFDRGLRVAEGAAQGKFLPWLGGKVAGQTGRNLGDAAAMFSPGQMAKATENYQHFVTFLGSLDDLSRNGIARALDRTSEATGNYLRMGDLERGWLRHLTGFYAWNRFIIPRIAKELWQNPGGLAAWSKALGGMERYLGPNAPFSKEGVPNHLRAWGISAPRYAQLQTMMPNIGSHQYTMQVIENPLTMGFALAPAFAGVLGMNPDKDAQRLTDLLGPMSHMMLEILTGRDVRTGGELPTTILDIDSFAGFRNSWVGRRLGDVYGRPFGDLEKLWNLYGDKSMQLDKYAELANRMAVGRAYLGIDNWAARGAKALGFDVEPLSIGGPFDPLTGGTGLGLQYPVDPLKQFMFRHRKATGRHMGRTQRSYEKLSPSAAPSE